MPEPKPENKNVNDNSTAEPDVPSAVTLTIDQALDKINVLEGRLEKVDMELQKTVQERDHYAGVVTAQVRAELLKRARKVTKLNEPALQAMSNDEIKQTLHILEIAGKAGGDKSIIFNGDSADEDGTPARFDLYTKRMMKIGAK
jgi:hypothetical protein